VGVCDDGEETQGAVEGPAGAAGGVDIRRLQLADLCKRVVGVCDDGRNPGGGLLARLEEQRKKSSKTEPLEASV
jgi:hypothetical protein